MRFSLSRKQGTVPCLVFLILPNLMLIGTLWGSHAPSGLLGNDLFVKGIYRPWKMQVAERYRCAMWMTWLSEYTATVIQAMIGLCSYENIPIAFKCGSSIAGLRQVACAGWRLKADATRRLTPRKRFGRAQGELREDRQDVNQWSSEHLKSQISILCAFRITSTMLVIFWEQHNRSYQ